MARPAYHDETAFLFELRFRIGGKLCIVRAWEREFMPPNHTRLDLELMHAGRVIFPRGSMHCGIPSHHSLDGISARECATSCFCIRPGDADADFFEHHTPEQLEWVTSFGEELGCEREARNETYLAAELAAARVPSGRAAVLAAKLCSLGRAYTAVAERLCGGEDVWGPYPGAGPRIEAAEKRKARIRAQAVAAIQGFKRMAITGESLHLNLEITLGRGFRERTTSTTLL